MNFLNTTCLRLQALHFEANGQLCTSINSIVLASDTEMGNTGWIPTVPISYKGRFIIFYGLNLSVGAEEDSYNQLKPV